MNSVRNISRRRRGLTLLAALLALTGCAATAQDAPRIIAIGDLHGDYESFRSLILEAGLINERGRWAGGDTIFVQTGDVPDRGPDTRKIIDDLRKLQKQARRKGGKVVTLVGNHEAMNMIGDLRYVHPGEYEAFATRESGRLRDAVYEANRAAIEQRYLVEDPTLSSSAIREKWMAATPLGVIEHQTAWRPDGEVGEWVAENPAVAIVGDSLFVHGGVSEKYASFSIDEINRAVSTALKARDLSDASIINDPYGPLWYRGYVRRPEAPDPSDDAGPGDASSNAPDAAAAWAPEEELSGVLAAYGVARMVIGHTPSLTGIKASFDGRLIQIDTGIADYYGGAQSFLRIEDGRVFAHDNGVIRELGSAPEP